MVMSNSDATYLDCGYAGWVIDGNNWCSPYKGWQVRIDSDKSVWHGTNFEDLYKNNPYDIMRRHGVDQDLWGNIMGGEAAIWSEQTSEDDVLSKVKYEAPNWAFVKLLSIKNVQNAFSLTSYIIIFVKMEPRTAAYGERLWLGDQAGTWHAAHHRSHKQNLDKSYFCDSDLSTTGTDWSAEAWLVTRSPRGEWQQTIKYLLPVHLQVVCPEPWPVSAPVWGGWGGGAVWQPGWSRGLRSGSCGCAGHYCLHCLVANLKFVM